MDRYSMIEKTGEGSYGGIYRASEKETNREVAIKLLKDTTHCDGVSPISLREVSILKSISHPCIVELIDVFYVGNDIALVFPYYKYDLSSFIRGHTAPLDPMLVCSYSYQLVAAVRALHVHRIIHRDIKPQNILVSETGMIKLCDFGMSRYFSVPTKQYSKGVVTLNYIAPEAICGKKFYDLSLDMWSVGCVIAFMVLGHSLFTGDSSIDQLHKIFSIMGTPSKSIGWVSDLDLSIFGNYSPVTMMDVLKVKDAWLADLVSKMLHLDPSKRITPAEALDHPYFNQLSEEIKRTVNNV